MSDDARQFGADLSTMIADLRAHAHRRIAIYDSMGSFLEWVAQRDAEFEQMVGHFLPPPPLPVAPHQATHADPSHPNGVDRDPDQIRRLNEALGRYGSGHDQ